MAGHRAGLAGQGPSPSPRAVSHLGVLRTAALGFSSGVRPWCSSGVLCTHPCLVLGEVRSGGGVAYVWVGGGLALLI